MSTGKSPSAPGSSEQSSNKLTRCDILDFDVLVQSDQDALEDLQVLYAPRRVPGSNCKIRF